MKGSKRGERPGNRLSWPPGRTDIAGLIGVGGVALGAGTGHWTFTTLALIFAVFSFLWPTIKWLWARINPRDHTAEIGVRAGDPVEIADPDQPKDD